MTQRHLVREKTETRDKEVCDSREDSEILNWASNFFFKELREVFKNKLDFHLCFVVLENCTKRNVMDWLGDALGSLCIACD